MKLTQDEALKYIKDAYIYMEKYNKDFSTTRKPCRFGQALWHRLPSSVTAVVYMTDQNWFYWEDDSMVLESFYLNCVETF